jgi:hypothetical protein
VVEAESGAFLDSRLSAAQKKGRANITRQKADATGPVSLRRTMIGEAAIEMPPSISAASAHAANLSSPIENLFTHRPFFMDHSSSTLAAKKPVKKRLFPPDCLKRGLPLMAAGFYDQGSNEGVMIYERKPDFPGT